MSTDSPSKVTLDLLDSVSSLSNALKNGQQGAREGLVDTCTKLIANLSHPAEQLVRLYWIYPAYLSIIRLSLDLKLFRALQRVSPKGEGATTIDIASQCSGNPDPEFVARMLRHLAAMGAVRETGASTFASTDMSNACTETAYEDTILFLGDYFQDVYQSTPAYFQQHGYKSPDSGVDCPYQFTFNCKGCHMFEHFEKTVPEQGKHFANMMDLWSRGRLRWFAPQFYPVQERLITGSFQDSEAFLVDVGGGIGHDLEGLRQAFPADIPGKLVLQDRPEIIELAKVDPSIVKQTHDFFTEQPVKGARAYLLHSIIQDWSDEANTKILKSIVPAMKKGYSKMVINDYVVPDQGAKWEQTGLDWGIMASLGARHRTQADHKKLYESAGLKITGIWRHPRGLDSVIELELA